MKSEIKYFTFHLLNRIKNHSKLSWTKYKFNLKITSINEQFDKTQKDEKI